MLQTLKELCALDAPSGYEEAVREELLRRIGKCADSGKNELVRRTQNLLVRGDDSFSTYTF